MPRERHIHVSAVCRDIRKIDEEMTIWVGNSSDYQLTDTKVPCGTDGFSMGVSSTNQPFVCMMSGSGLVDVKTTNGLSVAGSFPL